MDKPREYIVIKKTLSDGDYSLCDCRELPWYHKWHTRPRIWLAIWLVKSCARHAKPLSIRTMTFNFEEAK